MPNHRCRDHDVDDVIDHIEELASTHGMTTADLVRLIAARAEEGRTWPDAKRVITLGQQRHD